MGQKIELKIEHLVLDNDNPRITHADGQPQAMQKVVRDQKTKLAKLAESIIEHGLSPIERLMVMQVSTTLAALHHRANGDRELAVTGSTIVSI